MAQGYVADAADVSERRDPGDTARTRRVIGAEHGCALLEQSVVSFGPGRSAPRHDDERDELLYVVSGHGTLEVDGEPHELVAGAGAYVAAGESAVVVNDGPADLVVVAVTVPSSAGSDDDRRRVVVRWEDQPSLPASPNREFRYLVNQDAGCADATQFVGVIPPGRPGLHSHVYDEVVYVVEGEGVVHIGDASTPIAAGSCFHLPPGLVHAVENTGTGPMRVLGVFHPSGDPASRLYEEAPAAATG